MKAQTLILFEDDRVDNLYPASLTQAAFDLRLGAYTLGERIARHYDNVPVAFRCRPELAETLRERTPGSVVNTQAEGSALFINARLFASVDIAKQIPLEGGEAAYVDGGVLVAARLSSSRARTIEGAPLFDSLGGLPRHAVNVRWIQYLWDIVRYNAESIRDDFAFLKSGLTCLGSVYGGSHILNPAEFNAGQGTTVLPNTVLDARHGPIILGERVNILPHCYIQGPCSIGDGTLIKAGAKIYGGTSIGPMCKAGGEIENSIIQGYSNKQHDGFLGHSYIGEWVNLGADTNTSDLKNNYGKVSVSLRGREISTNSQFIGLFAGDHTKSGINTMFNTGSTTGVGCNVFGGGFPPRSLPSFSWGGAGNVAKYEIEKFLETARTVMARRNRSLGPAEETLLRELHAKTAH